MRALRTAAALDRTSARRCLETGCRLRYGFHSARARSKSSSGELEVAREHPRERHQVVASAIYSRRCLFLGPCNHLGGYFARFAQVGTDQVDDEDSTRPPRSFPS